MTKEQKLWQFLVDYNEICTDEEVALANALCGYSVETMWKLIRIRTELNSMEQLKIAGYQGCNESLDD